MYNHLSNKPEFEDVLKIIEKGKIDVYGPTQLETNFDLEEIDALLTAYRKHG